MGVRGIVGMLLCALLLAPASADAAARKPAPKIALRFMSVSQKRLLKQKAIRVKVHSSRAGRMRLYASARHRKSEVVVTGARSIKLRAHYSRVVKLRLSKAGRKELKGCVKRRLVVTAVPVVSVVAGTGRPKSVRKLMKRDRKLCRKHAGHGNGGHGGNGNGNGGNNGNGNGGSNGNGGNGNGGNGPGEQRPIDFATPSDASRCDFLDLAVCLQPWPND